MPKRVTKKFPLTFTEYRRAGRKSKMRRAYLQAFMPKMVYRTTKTENPRTTTRMVSRVLRAMH